MSLDFYLSYEMDGNVVWVFDANITHNLGKMAGKAGIYDALWHQRISKLSMQKT